jgi:hypothetical protein
MISMVLQMAIQGLFAGFLQSGSRSDAPWPISRARPQLGGAAPKASCLSARVTQGPMCVWLRQREHT